MPWRPQLGTGEQSHGSGVDPRALWIVAVALEAWPLAILVGETFRPQRTWSAVALLVVLVAMWSWLLVTMLLKPVDVITGPHGIGTVDAFGRRRDIAWTDIRAVHLKRYESRPDFRQIDIDVATEARDWRWHGRSHPLRINRTLTGRSLRRIVGFEELVHIVRRSMPRDAVLIET